MSRKFEPDVSIFNTEGKLVGQFVRRGEGALSHYIDAHTWYNGGAVLRQAELNEWGWSVVPISKTLKVAG